MQEIKRLHNWPEFFLYGQAAVDLTTWAITLFNSFLLISTIAFSQEHINPNYHRR